MNQKEISKINIIYHRTGKYIKIFGHEFVINNKNKCKMIIDNNEYELTEKYNVKGYNNKIKIILKGIDNITNMSYMFYECSSLLSLPDISNWDTNSVTDMCYMFYECSSLK